MHKLTYIYIPLVILASAIVVNCFHTESFNPYEYIKGWSYIQALILAYFSVAILRLNKNNEHALALFIPAATLLLVATVFSAFNFSGLGPLYNLSHPASVCLIYFTIGYITLTQSIKQTTNHPSTETTPTTP